MEPRYLGVVVVLAKSLARIHESNLKKQGVLALTFVDPMDYDKIRENDRISVLLLPRSLRKTVTTSASMRTALKTASRLSIRITMKQLTWFRAGS